MTGDGTGKVTLLTPNVGEGIFTYMAQQAQVGDQFFGPGTPMQPMAQAATEGRAFDFQTAINLQPKPKREGITFEELRALADGYDLLRLVIETRKDQIEKLGWEIRKRGEKSKPGKAKDARAQQIEAFLQQPDQEHTWGQWLRMILEDLFVLDAPAIYLRRTKGGDVFALEAIDGATIKRILDPQGRTPMEGPAYQQYIKGVPTANYDRTNLLYMPRNLRTNKVYGYSPVEQIIATVNIALRRQLAQMSFYTDGNTPDLIFGVPKEWTVEQLKTFQAWWDSLLVGNAAMRARARFVPGDVKPFDTKSGVLKDEYDEWLARIVCYAFSVSAQPFIKQMNRSTAETAQQQAFEEGLAPIQNWIKSLIDWILRNWFGAPDLEFDWMMDRALDPLVQSQRDQLDIQSGIRDVNECREDRGLEPLSPEELEARKPTPPAPLAAGPGTDAPEKGPGGSNPEPPKPPAENPPAEKLAKRAPLKPINRNRPSAEKLRKRLQKTVLHGLKAQVRPMAEALTAAIGKMDRPGLLKRLVTPGHVLAKSNREDALRILEAIGIDWHELGDALEPILEDIARDGIGAAAEQLGLDVDDLFEQANKKAIDWAQDHAASLVTEIEETTRKRLAQDVSAAIEEGLSVDELADRLSESYAFSDTRADLISRTELAFADVKGNCLAYAESGVVDGLIWITANEGEDDRTCEDCQINNGARVGIGPDGEATEPFPSGDTTVPAHPGCLCDLLPALSPEE